MGTLAASPTMVGAVTTLIVVAVFLAYNANNGLPFVPVYRVSVEIPNAARLTNNNEVRIGGHRVGVVESIDAIHPDDATATAQASGDNAGVGTTGGAIARLNLKLDKAAEPLPKDSIFRVRYRSSFGLKYLEIVRGEGEAAPEGFTFDGTDDGATCRLPTDPATFTSQIPESAQNGCFQQQTEFDEINDTFDTETRTNARTNLEGFGNAFAGRGTSLNDAIYSLEPLFRGLKPVAEMLVQPDTQLRRFFPELADAARIVAPVAEQQAEFFTNAGIAFAAISSDPASLQATIEEGVPTLQTGIDVLPRQRPFLREFTTLSHDLRPGVTDLRATLPVLNEAIRVGTPVLNDSTQTNRDLRDALVQLNQLVSQPSTKVSLQRLEDTFDTAKPLAEHVVPAQTVCNYLTYWGTTLPESFTDRDQVGFSHREILVNSPPGDLTVEAGGVPVVVPGEVKNSLGGYSGLNANGQASPSGTFEPYKLPILYGPAYGPAGQHGTQNDCQGGQNGYPLGQLLADGQPKSNPAIIASDLPGSRGPTTAFWDDNGNRVLFDSRIDSRQPGTWPQFGGSK
jgi:ABC-type transporter Mla subunit MlaD